MRRLLLVEDDPSIRRYVVLALEDEGIDLIDEAATLATALSCLRRQAYDLVLTDLMLPDGHGTDLLQLLRDEPGLRQGATLVAFSAGVAPSMRQRLLDLGVDRILEKPVPLQDLIDCVRGAAPAVAQRLAEPADDECFAVERHFGGQRSLFEQFKADTRQQFAIDITQGDAFVSAGDGPALGRLAHSLKTVLRLLGRPAAASRAATLEQAANGPAPSRLALQDAWQRLRQDLA